MMDLQRILISNRSEIASRIQWTLSKLSIPSVVVFTQEDLNSEFVRNSSASYPIESYLSIEEMIRVARLSRSTAIIPGYGFLSEVLEFAECVEKAGLNWIGPSPTSMLMLSDKATCRDLAFSNGIPTIPGSDPIIDVAHCRNVARHIGFPGLLKNTAGGGGMGQFVIYDESEVEGKFMKAVQVGNEWFGGGNIIYERYIPKGKHIEIQIFGDRHGDVVHLGTRECSAQRNRQKVIEESPCSSIPSEVLREMERQAVRLGELAGYRSAGTVEFIVDMDDNSFYLLEVNTRLQVEHTVTESRFPGLDLVEWMIYEALDDSFSCVTAKESLSGGVPNGYSIQARVYAENPSLGYRPSPGTITELTYPEHTRWHFNRDELTNFDGTTRIDSHLRVGDEIPPTYDMTIGKVIAFHPTSREKAIERLQMSLEATRINGSLATNVDFIQAALQDDEFKDASYDTVAFLKRVSSEFSPPSIEIVQPGLQTTIQDWPGRIGYWDIGMPPSGPCDWVSAVFANQIVGNDPSCAVIECTLVGPSIKFHKNCIFALTGSDAKIKLSGEKIQLNTPIFAEKGQVLKVGNIISGFRVYVAIQGGLDTPNYLGSQSTFPGGSTGGLHGQPLRPTDWIPLQRHHDPDMNLCNHDLECPPNFVIPSEEDGWTINVTVGPHLSEDLINKECFEDFLGKAEYIVDHNSNRLKKGCVVYYSCCCYFFVLYIDLG